MWNAIRDAFGEDPEIHEWLGYGVIAADGYFGIIAGGISLADRINRYDFKDGEKLNIVAHSHGGNVVKYASWLINHSIDNLVTLGTPQNLDLPVTNKLVVKNHCNVSSLADQVQFLGSSPTQIYRTAYYAYHGARFANRAFWALLDGDFDSFTYYSLRAARTFSFAAAWYLSTKIDPFASRNAFVDTGDNPFTSHSNLHTASVWNGQVKGACGL